MVELSPYDPAEYLKSEESQTAFLNDALETGDAGYIAHALGIISRAKGMATIAKDAGITREALYKSLSEKGDPKLSTLLGVIKSLNMRLNVAQQ